MARVSKKKHLHASSGNNGILYVTYKLKDKEFYGMWDAGIGREYVSDTLNKRGASNIVFGYKKSF